MKHNEPEPPTIFGKKHINSDETRVKWQSFYDAITLTTHYLFELKIYFHHVLCAAARQLCQITAKLVGCTMIQFLANIYITFVLLCYTIAKMSH